MNCDNLRQYVTQKIVTSSADRPGESENHSRGAVQHRGGEGRLAREKFAGAPSPQKKPISLF